MAGRTTAKTPDARVGRGRGPAAPLAAAAVLLLFPLSWPGAASLGAHDEAVLESPRSSVPAGGVLELTGKDFTAGESYALRLVGALREYDLREVEPGEEGSFRLELEIPSRVAPGSYQLVAVAGDGDVVARLDLQILEGYPGLSELEGGDGHGPAPAGDGPRARADDIRIERDRSGLEWGAIGLLVGLAGGLGLGLLRRAAAGER